MNWLDLEVKRSNVKVTARPLGQLNTLGGIISLSLYNIIIIIITMTMFMVLSS